MPQASDEARAAWGPDQGLAVYFLRGAGYKLSTRFGWILPHPEHTPTLKELSAINYLIWEWEWDYCGIVREGVK